MKKLPGHYPICLLGLVIVLGSCYKVDISIYTNPLQLQKSTAESMFVLFHENCVRYYNIRNEGVLLYIDLQSKQNMLINQLASDIQNGNQDFNHSYLLTEVNENFNKFSSFVLRTIPNECSNGYVPKIRFDPREIMNSIAELVPFIYDEIKGKELKKEVIRTLENLRIAPYQELIKSKNFD